MKRRSCRHCMRCSARSAHRLPRLGSRRVHRQSRAWSRTRHQCAPHAPDDERADRVPAAAALDRSLGIHPVTRTGPDARDRRRRGARPPGRADVCEPPEEELRQAFRLGGTRGDFLLPPVRRRHAGVFVCDRSLPVRSRGDGRALALRRATHRPRLSIATRPAPGAGSDFHAAGSHLRWPDDPGA